MSFHVEVSAAAQADIQALMEPLWAQCQQPADLQTPKRAMQALRLGFNMLARSPLSGRRVNGDPLLREWLLPFARGGCVVLIDTQSAENVRILALRPASESDWY